MADVFLWYHIAILPHGKKILKRKKRKKHQHKRVCTIILLVLLRKFMVCNIDQVKPKRSLLYSTCLYAVWAAYKLLLFQKRCSNTLFYLLTKYIGRSNEAHSYMTLSHCMPKLLNQWTGKRWCRKSVTVSGIWAVVHWIRWYRCQST